MTIRTCTVDECARPHKGRGLCDMHLQRLRRTGTTASPVRTLAERFWAKVDRRGLDECWPWTAAVNEHGYGVMRPSGRRAGPTVKAHRVSAQLAGMNITGRMVLHSCDNPPCVNPAHLRPGGASDNAADMVERGRSVRGSRNSLAVLTEVEVARIRRDLEAGRPRRDIAAEHGVHVGTIGAIARGDTWRHVEAITGEEVAA